ncbi:MAG TPA: hypothetical protein VLY04_09435 [Bryobacteraceae bacterium]|nr:hypothetical protein [Bryobacteraceae bacterium]
MTRRDFCCAASAAALVPSVAHAPLIVPIHVVLDSRAKWRPEQIGYFWSHIWPEAVQNFGSGGIRFESAVRTGEIRRSPADNPIFTGLNSGVVNMVVTDHVPLVWDKGRGWSGVTTRYDGYDLCVIALNFAHGNQIPLLSLNTCVHELLHALLHDIFEKHPAGVAGQTREFRIDWYATRLWLFHDGAAIREAARTYVEHLRSEAASRA